MLKNWQKFILALIYVLPPLVLLMVSIVFLAAQFDRLMETADVILAQELARRFEREVIVGEARVRRPGVAVLEDVRIAAGERLHEGAILTATRITIYYDWRGLLLRNRGAGAIHRVVIADPEINIVHTAEGRFNIADLFRRPPGQPPGPPFTGRIEFESGDITYRDYLAKVDRLPAVINLRDVDGFIDAARQPRYAFSLSGRGDGQKLGTLQAAGIYNSRARSLAMDINAREVSAAYLADYFGTPTGVDVLSGRLRIVTGVNADWSRKRLQLSLTGSAQVRNVAARVPRVAEPVRNVSGTIALAGNRAAVDLRGSLAGSGIQLTGTIADFGAPRVDLALRAPSLDFGRVARVLDLPLQARQLDLSGRGSLAARVTGLLSDPTVQVTAQVPRARVGELDGRDVSIVAQYQRNRLDISALRMQVEGAPVELAGTIALAPTPALQLQGRVGRVPLESLPLPQYIAVRGIATGTFSVTGPAARPTIVVNAQVSPVVVEGISAASISARLQINGSMVQVQRLVVSGVAGGNITAQGVVGPQAIRLNIDAESINLAQIAQRFDVPDVAGTAFFSGAMTGTPSNPQLAGRLELFDGRISDVSFNVARMDFSATRSRIEVTDGVIRAFPAQVAFSGAASGLGMGRVQFRVNADVDNVQAQRLLELLGADAPVTGTMVGSISGSGVYTSPSGQQAAVLDATASADLRLEDGTAYGIAISDARAILQLDDSTLVVQQISAVSDGAQFGASGTVELSTGAVGLEYSLSDFDLSRWQALTGDEGGPNLAQVSDAVDDIVTASGVLNVSGTMTGTLDDPVITANGEIANPLINYKRFDSATFTAAYSDGVIDTLQAVLTRGEQQYSASASDYDIESNCLSSATLVISDVSIPDLWDMLRSSPFVTSPEGESIREVMESTPRISTGRLNATVELSGCITNPDGALQLAATNIGINGQEIQSIEAVASADGGVITLDRFVALSGEMRVEATGSPLYADGNLQLELTAQNLDLTRLRPWLGANTPGGVLSAEFRVQGNVAAPQVIGSVEVLNPSYGGIAFDRLRASTIEVMQDRIDISGVRLAEGAHEAVAEGYLPWDWDAMTIPSDQPLELAVRLQEQDLSVLTTFTDYVLQEGTSGTIQAQLLVAGTLAQPALDGSFVVRDGNIAIRDLVSRLTNVNIDLTFDGNSVQVNEFSANSSLGGSLRILPSVPEDVAVADIEGLERSSYITLGTLEDARVNLLMVVNGFIVEERNLLGFQETVRTRIDAGLVAVGTVQSPLIAGLAIRDAPKGILLTDSLISFVTPEALPGRQPVQFAIDPRFDVDLVVGDDVRLAPPNMSLLVVGQGTLAGTLSEPDFNVALEVEQGSLRLAAARLQVVPGGMIYLTYAPAEVRVDLEAATTVFTTGPFGDRQRYRITMSVTGPATNLQIGLESSPPGLSREQMLAALGHVEGLFTSGEAALEQELQSVLTAVGTGVLFAPIESLFIEQLGFEEFVLEFEPDRPLAIYFSRRLFGNFYLSIYRVLTGGALAPTEQTYEVVLSYRLRNKYQFSGSIDDQETVVFGVEYTTSFW